MESLRVVDRDVSTNTDSLHQAMRSIVYVSLFVAWWFAAIGAFLSSLFRLLDVVPSQVRFVVGRLLCFLILGIQASRIWIPLSPLMLLRWSLIWIASLTLRVYQWGSRSINLASFQIGRCPVSLACSETAEAWVRASRISLSCFFILSCIALPVSPMYTLPHSHGILQTTPSCLVGWRVSFGRTKWDLRVVSDLKTVRTPCCCRQRRRTSDTPFL